MSYPPQNMTDSPGHLPAFPAELIQIIRSADHILVLTGAGISSESGIPTFRQAQTGLWARYRPEDLATPEAFHNNPQRVWEWYTWRRDLIKNAKPNPGHDALVKMENRTPNFTLVTQNVDNLHRAAGSRKIIEFHGNIFRTKCSKENLIVESWPDTGEVPPRCPRCSHFLRPDVVWFGEPIPEAVVSAAFSRIATCQVFFSIGTSGLVEPAASLPRIARQHGSKVVEINLEPTPLTHLADFSLHGRSGKLLPELVNEVWPEIHPSSP